MDGISCGSRNNRDRADHPAYLDNGADLLTFPIVSSAGPSNTGERQLWGTMESFP